MIGFASYLVLFFTCPFLQKKSWFTLQRFQFQETILTHEGGLNLLSLLDMCLSDSQNKNDEKH